MKKIVIVALLLMSASVVRSQQFAQKYFIDLPDSIKSANAEWVDLDNDGILDILMLSKNQDGESYLMFAKGDTVATPFLYPLSKAIIDFQHYVVADYNRDNSMDVLVSGFRNGLPATAVYTGNSDFTFDEAVLPTPPFTTSLFVDLDDDARVEWIVSGEDSGSKFVNIFKEENPGQWTLVHDSLKFNLTALETFDADGDGTHDLFISGKMGTDSLFTGFLINAGKFYFKPLLRNSWIGSTSIADLNGDGIFDVVFSGKDKNGNTVSKIYESSEHGFIIRNESMALKESVLFVADLNSDGIVDFSVHGKNSSNDTLNVIRYSASVYDTLLSHQVVAQRFGDIEHDGDLDVMQVIKKTPIQLSVLKNSTAKNRAPGKPTNAIALSVFNRVFVYWEKSGDDHTTVPSITYDLAFLSQDNELQGGEFELIKGKRLKTSHGNNRTQNFRLIKEPSVAFTYAIQSVDNSLHAGGQCIGSGVLNCGTVEAEKIIACEDESTTLQAPVESLWFSFASGYLGKSSSLDFQTNSADTVFYFNPEAPGCDALKVWTVKIQNDTVKTGINTTYACEGAVLELTVEEGWDNVTWTSEHKGPLGSANSIQYTVTQQDSVFVTMSSASGCTIIQKTAMLISKPVVEVVADHYKIMKGSEVQLTATGAERYVWAPATGLSQTDIPNPIASPATTTEYKVTGYDSLNCTGQASVIIEVENTGFIPNLFTPNDDGTNDELKIYGLSSAHDFSLMIYNREGSLVFKSTDITEVSQRGWNGFTNGVKQPTGVYFWKVKGSLATGGKLLLNGKESGSILLVR